MTLWVMFLVLGPPFAQLEEVQEIRMLTPQGDAELTHLCAHGLRDPATGGRVKRPLLVYASFPLRRVAQQCPGPIKHPSHVALRDVRGLGHCENSYWTEGLCRALGRDVRDFRSWLRAQARGTQD